VYDRKPSEGFTVSIARISRTVHRFQWDRYIALTTSISQGRSDLPFAVCDACSVAGSVAGEFARLNGLVELAFGYWNGHAGVAVGMLRLANRRRTSVFVVC
jgi:hypothetical protein